MAPEPENPDSETPEIVISDSVKSLDDSVNVNVIVAVSPIPSELMFVLRAMLGV